MLRGRQNLPDTAVCSPASRVAAAGGNARDQRVDLPSPAVPKSALLQDVLAEVHETSSLATPLHNDVRMQLEDTRRRADELEAMMADNARQLSIFVGQTARGVNNKLRSISPAHADLARELTHKERTAQKLRP